MQLVKGPVSPVTDLFFIVLNEASAILIFTIYVFNRKRKLLL